MQTRRIIILLDIYGDLLTKRQAQALRYMAEEDFSLAEISDLLGISRQGVHDAVKKAVEKLEELEKTLGIYSKYLKRTKQFEELKKKITDLSLEDTAREELVAMIEQMVD